MIKIKLVITVFLFATSTYAQQIGMMLTRCNEDNLGPELVASRNSWALKCFPQYAAYFSFWNSQSPKLYALVYNSSTGSWKGPLTDAAPCDNWVLKEGCVGSCYPGDQHVLFGSGYLPISVAVARSEAEVITLTSDSNLEDLKYQKTRVRNYSASRTKYNEEIYKFSTFSGGEIKVTAGHPVLINDGVMVKANTVRVGDSLIKANGERDLIADIQFQVVPEKVYNVAPDSDNPIENIVVAQDFLMGSAAYQYMEWAQSIMGRKLFRELLK